MSQELTVKVDETVAKTKEEAWGRLGRGIYTTELKLQAIAQDAILKIKIPTTIEDVKEAEDYLKVLKRTEKSLEEQRKEITSRFDAKTQDLMQSEKSIGPHITTLTNACIKIKKAEEDRVKLLQKKDDEIKQIRESLQTQLANYESMCQTKILKQVNSAYEYAINNNIGPDEVGEHIKKCSSKFTAFDFAANPADYICHHIEQSVYNDLVKELWLIDAEQYLDKYQEDLKGKFEFYEIEFNNKAEAIKKSKEAEAITQSKITDDATNKTIAASLESTATVLTGSAALKAVKKAYKIDMPETEESANIIMKAYFANMALCKSKLSVKKWFNFGVSNMMVALDKCKNDDNGFCPAGIIFVEIDKL